MTVATEIRREAPHLVLAETELGCCGSIARWLYSPLDDEGCCGKVSAIALRVLAILVIALSCVVLVGIPCVINGNSEYRAYLRQKDNLSQVFSATTVSPADLRDALITWIQRTYPAGKRQIDLSVVLQVNGGGDQIDLLRGSPGDAMELAKTVQQRFDSLSSDTSISQFNCWHYNHFDIRWDWGRGRTFKYAEM